MDSGSRCRMLANISPIDSSEVVGKHCKWCNTSFFDPGVLPYTARCLSSLGLRTNSYTRTVIRRQLIAASRAKSCNVNQFPRVFEAPSLVNVPTAFSLRSPSARNYQHASMNPVCRIVVAGSSFLLGSMGRKQTSDVVALKACVHTPEQHSYVALPP